jgi:hypothetical protein
MSFPFSPLLSSPTSISSSSPDSPSSLLSPPSHFQPFCRCVSCLASQTHYALSIFTSPPTTTTFASRLSAPSVVSKPPHHPSDLPAGNLDLTLFRHPPTQLHKGSHANVLTFPCHQQPCTSSSKVGEAVQHGWQPRKLI